MSSKKAKFILMECYKERNSILKDLGYRSYLEYLKSEDWKTIRLRILQKTPDCCVCGHKAFHVHHMSYDIETLLGLKDFCLVSLCDVCHKDIEFLEGKKLNLKEANNRLFYKAGSNPFFGRKWIYTRRKAATEFWIERAKRVDGLHEHEYRQKRKKEKKEWRIKNKANRKLKRREIGILRGLERRKALETTKMEKS